MKLLQLRIVCFLSVIIFIIISVDNLSCAADKNDGSRVVATAAKVRVPDVLSAIKNHTFHNSYDSNPDAIASELKTFASRVVRNSGLKPKIELQSIELPDTQVPKPGTVVPRGTIVRVCIGFGD